MTTFNAWKCHHLRCGIIRQKCTSQDYPNLRKLIKQSVVLPPPETIIPIVDVPVPVPIPPTPSPVVREHTSPISPTKISKYSSNPVIFEDNIHTKVYRYKSQSHSLSKYSL